MAIVFPFGTSSRNRSRRVDAMSTVRRLRSRKSARSSWRVISVNGRAIEDHLTYPLPRLARFAMLRQAGHVATCIVDGLRVSHDRSCGVGDSMVWQGTQRGGTLAEYAELMR